MLVRKFQSSNIRSACLDEGTGLLEITFHNGARWRYQRVGVRELDEWCRAASAGSWFNRVLKGNPHRYPPLLVKRDSPTLESELAARVAVVDLPELTSLTDPASEPISSTTPPLPEHVHPHVIDAVHPHVIDVVPIGKPEIPDRAPEPPAVPIGKMQDACEHALLRMMNDGACPVCGPSVSSAEGGSHARVLGTDGGSSSGKAPRSTSDRENPESAGSTPAPPATIRPPTVEQPTPSSAPVGAAHGSDEGPAYLRRSLTTLTREEATELLTRIDAMRMRHSVRRFIRGRRVGGRWVGGAWDVVEGGVVLDWNWHHDAICMHTQAMLEEWILAGLATPEEVDATLRDWARVRRGVEGLELELALVEGYRAHWETTCDKGTYKQRTQDLAVNVGPISLKSRIVMVMAVAWMWTRVPSWEVFCASGTPSNVSRDSLACRDLVTSSWYRETFDVRWSIKSDLDRVDKWGTTAGGTRESRGAGGSVTGIHADGILLDDPDDAAKVWSDAARRDAMTFWLALGNRIKDPRRPLRIVVQQNLHDEDLTSRLVRLGMPRLAIPVEFSPSERDRLYTAPFGWRDPRTNDRQPLHPTRFPPEFLASERVRLGTHGFEAQYNCNPRPLDGGMIKRGWFQFFRIEDDDRDGVVDRPRPTGCIGAPGSPPAPPLVLKTKRKHEVDNDISWIPGLVVRSIDLDWITITVDATFGSLSDTASAVGLLVIGGKGMRRFVFDDRSEPMTFHATVAAIKALIGKWPVRRVIIELKANGASIIEELTKQIRDASVIGVDGRPATVTVEPINPEGGKESRAAAMVPAIEAGMVYLLDGAPWLEGFVGEVCVFPNAKRDDRVDALSQLMTHYRDSDVVGRWRNMGKR